MDTTKPTPYKETTLIRCIQSEASASTENSWVNAFANPACVLHDGDVIQLHSGSVDIGTSESENISLKEDTTIEIDFVPCLQHVQDDVAQTVFYDTAPTIVDNEEKSFFYNMPNGGVAYPINTHLPQTQDVNDADHNEMYQIKFVRFQHKQAKNIHNYVKLEKHRSFTIHGQDYTVWLDKPQNKAAASQSIRVSWDTVNPNGDVVKGGFTTTINYQASFKETVGPSSSDNILKISFDAKTDANEVFPIVSLQQIKTLNIDNFETYNTDGSRFFFDDVGANNVSLNGLQVISIDDYNNLGTLGINSPSLIVYEKVSIGPTQHMQSDMRVHKKRIHFKKGTYNINHFLHDFGRKLSEFESNISPESNKIETAPDSFLQSTASLENANDIPVAVNGVIELQQSSVHGGLFFHPSSGAFEQINPASGETTSGREYAFARKLFADKASGGLETDPLDPIYYGASDIGIAYENENFSFVAHTPWYDTTVLKSEESSAAKMVGFTKYTNGALRRAFDSATNTETAFPGNNIDQERTAVILPAIMPVSRHGMILLKEVKAYHSDDASVKSDVFDQLGIDWSKHYVETYYKITKFPGAGFPSDHLWRVEVPVQVETGIHTSSEIAVLDSAVTKTSSSLSKPFYYTKFAQQQYLRLTPDANFVAGATSQDQFNGKDVVLDSSKNINLFDYSVVFKSQSAGSKPMVLTKNAELETKRYSSFDIAADFFPFQSTSVSTLASKAFKISAVVPNYYNKDSYISASASDGLEIVYRGSPLPVTNVRITILDSETGLPPVGLGSRSIFTWTVKQQQRIPKSLKPLPEELPAKRAKRF